MKIKKLWILLVTIFMPLFFVISCSTKYIDDSSDFKEFKTEISVEKDKNYQFKQLTPVYTDNHKKHYITIMVDSLVSFRLLDTIKKLKIFYEDKNNGCTPAQMAVIKEKLDFFNGFNLKMNVITPGYRTDKGLQGTIDGPWGAITTAEMHRTIYRTKQINNFYLNLFNSIGQSDNIDKIYVQAAEFFNSQAGKKPIDSSAVFNQDWTPESLFLDKKITKKVRDKIDISKRVSNAEKSSSIIDSIKIIDPNKNTFSTMVYDGIHDGSYYTYGIGDEWSLAPEKIFNTFVKIKRELIKKHIWDDTEIIFVSDHGKSTSDSYNCFHNKNYKYNNQYFNKQINEIKLTSDKSKFDSVGKFEKIHSKTSTKNTAILTSWSSILYKKRYQANSSLKDDPIKLDFKNMYMNADAIVQLFHDMGIDPYYLKFNYYNYIPAYKNKQNINGDFNSFVDNPFNKDLSKRNLLTFDHTDESWGIKNYTYIGYSGKFCARPWWNIDTNGNVTFDEKALDIFIMEKPIINKVSWFNNLVLNTMKKNKNQKSGLELMGKLFYYLDQFKKVNP